MILWCSGQCSWLGYGFKLSLPQQLDKGSVHWREAWYVYVLGNVHWQGVYSVGECSLEVQVFFN